MNLSSVDLVSALHYSPIGMAIVSLAGDWLEVNPALTRLLGYSRDELLRGDFQSITHPDDLALDLAYVRQLLAGELPRYAMEKRYIRKDGRIVWVELHVTLVWNNDGTPKHFISQIVDITERREIAEALRERDCRLAEQGVRDSEQQLCQLAEHLSEVVWMSTVEKDQILYISPTYEKVWGRSCESLRAAPRSWIETVHPDDRERILEVARTKQAHSKLDLEYRIVRPDGEVRWVYDRTFPLHDSTGRPYRIAGIAEDITDRKRIEEQYRQAQKMEAIGQLAGGVAHDFNNILAAIMMDVDDAASQPGLSEEVLEPIRGISAAAERAANLTRQLLQFCRKQMMQPRQIDLNETVANVAKLFRRVLPESVTTELRLGHAPTLTFADPGMLDQVMMNLAVNARDAMPSGGTFTIETGHRVLTEEDAGSILDASPGLHVVLRVTDSGCGITAEQMPHIFEPFFTTKEPGRGTGLGLATVFGIVKQHRGWITVSSTVGHGTTFEVLLPATTDPVVALHDVGARPLALGGNETILLVEDEPVLRRVIRTLLVRKGYRVLEACSGLDALAVWERSADTIDLLFTDLVMPDGIDGHDLANELQACKPNLKVILTSGYSNNAELQVGQCYLAKPCQPRRLLEVIRESLEAPAAR